MQRIIVNELKAPANVYHHLQKRYRSTWSPFCKIFNNKPKTFVAAAEDTKNAGLFLVPELCDKTGFLQLQESCFKRTEELVSEAIDSANRKRKLVQVFDDLSDNLCQVADLAAFVRIAHVDENYVKAAGETCNSVTNILEKLNTNKTLYEALEAVVIAGDKIKQTALCDRVNSLFLFDFQQNGIHLGDELRKDILSLNNVILQVGYAFVSGCGEDRLIDKKEVPTIYHKHFEQTKTHLRIHGSYGNAQQSQLRELGYRLYIRYDRHQDILLDGLLDARSRLADCCGFETYAKRCLRGTLLENPNNVMDFLDHLAIHLEPRAQLEFKAIRQMRNADLGVDEPLPPWDLSYYSAKYKAKLFDINSSEYSAYFSLGTCMEGLSMLFQKLYGITLEYTEMEPGECWAPNVYKLVVTHETEGPLGTIYCDFFTRPSKMHQDSQFTIRGGRLTSSGLYQSPIVVVMLNMQAPDWHIPCLLTPSLLENLFHEMGHAMHSMLGRTVYQHVTGTRCATDVAEVPSVLMEFFARDRRVLRTFARHNQTGEPMPEPLLGKMCESRRVLQASEMQLQTFYSALDQFYHGQTPLNGTTTEVLRKVQARYYYLPHVADTAWQHYFAHLYGYGGKYYSYLSSRALASWIWARYFELDPLSRESGERLRKEFLAHGGAKAPLDLMTDFLQREPTPYSLAEALIYELLTKCHIPKV